MKLSSDDAVLPKMVVAKWAEFEPHVAQAVTFHDGLMPQLDAVVCTGGANAAAISRPILDICHTCFEVRELRWRCLMVTKRKPTLTPRRRHFCALWHGVRSVKVCFRRI